MDHNKRAHFCYVQPLLIQFTYKIMLHPISCSHNRRDIGREDKTLGAITKDEVTADSMV